MKRRDFISAAAAISLSASVAGQSEACGLRSRVFRKRRCCAPPNENVSDLALEAQELELSREISKGPSVTDEIYRLADGHQVCFKTFTGLTQPITRHLLDNKWAQTVADPSKTEVWDDQWYWTTTPVNTYILMMAGCVGTRDYRHVFIMNDPTAWHILGNRDTVIGQGHHRRRKKSMLMRGTRFDFDVWNPANVGMWTSNHIILGWGK